MNIRPLGDRILVQRVAEEEKTSGGLFIPDNAKEKPQQAIVISYGNAIISTHGGICEGTKVLFSKYSGTELKFGGLDYLMIREEDILAVIGD